MKIFQPWPSFAIFSLCLGWNIGLQRGCLLVWNVIYVGRLPVVVGRAGGEAVLEVQRLRALHPVHEVEVAHLVLVGGSYHGVLVARVVHGAPSRQAVAVPYGDVVGHGVEHLGGEGVAPAQLGPVVVALLVATHPVPGDHLAEGVGVGAVGERVDHLFLLDLAGGLHVLHGVGRDAAPGAQQHDAGQARQRPLRVVQEDSRIVRDSLLKTVHVVHLQHEVLDVGVPAHLEPDVLGQLQHRGVPRPRVHDLGPGALLARAGRLHPGSVVARGHLPAVPDWFGAARLRAPVQQHVMRRGHGRVGLEAHDVVRPQGVYLDRRAQVQLGHGGPDVGHEQREPVVVVAGREGQHGGEHAALQQCRAVHVH